MDVRESPGVGLDVRTELGGWSVPVTVLRGTGSIVMIYIDSNTTPYIRCSNRALQSLSPTPPLTLSAGNLVITSDIRAGDTLAQYTGQVS